MARQSATFGSDRGRKLDRGQAFMLGTQREQRAATRFFVTVPVAVFVNGVKHVGLVRDLSGKGLFVYSDFQPAFGAALRFTWRLPNKTRKHLAVTCRGRVVRVEAGVSGAAIGIAVAVDEYEFRKLPPASSPR
jgi:PilZ domain